MTLQTEHVSILGKDSIVVGCGVVLDNRVGDRTFIEDLKASVPARKYVVLTDSSVHQLFWPTLRQCLLDGGLEEGVSMIVKPVVAGEGSKARHVKEEIEDWMLENNCGRDACVIAIGGGVIGDLCGYVAGTYMRGIPLVQVPTTMLAMVDSSIGGKNGINTSRGKNLVGTFHQPKRIYIDLKFVETLPIRELRNGLAEVIKAGAIWDEQLFCYLEEHVDEILNKDYAALLHVTVASVKMKAEVVTLDEKESSGVRSILNYGHSIGHAVEGLVLPRLLHGECVSIGMIKEAEIARAMDYLSSASVSRLIRCLKSYSLPVSVPTDMGLTVPKLMKKLAIDKKNEGDTKMMVLLKDIGTVVQRKPIAISDDLVKLVLSREIKVIPPARASINASVRVPGSKSISNRVLLMVGLGKGECELEGLLHSDDTQVMLDALSKLGVGQVKWVNGGKLLQFEGAGGKLQVPSTALYMGNAGTAARFLTCALTLVPSGASEITGCARMKERPIGPLVDALRSFGCNVSCLEREGFLPLKIQGIGGLPGGEMSLSAKISSQYVSSVLISAPYANSSENVTVSLQEEKSISEPYVDMTIKMMEQFGIKVTKEGRNKYSVERGVYKNPQSYCVECDASSATYPQAIAAITGSKITVEGVGCDSIQGDAQFHTLLEKMGCQVSQDKLSTTIIGPAGRLKAVDVDMESMTDAFMTAAALAAVADGTSKITGIANQRVKECNRIAVMIEELGKCGCTVRELEDGIEVVGCEPEKLHGAHIACHNDHRIAMSFAVLGCAVPEVVITDKQCVEKTYPEFWDHLVGKLGIDVHPAYEENTEVDIKRVVFIGMRGAGKTTAANSAANATVVDLDAVMSDRVGMPCGEYAKREGWPTFRQVESDILREELAKSCETIRVVSCGGGVVETTACRELLKKEMGVIHVVRPVDDIQRYLQQDLTRPDLPQSIRETWEKRAPLYEECSKYVLGSVHPKAVNALINQITRPRRPIASCPARESFFLSLTFSNIKEALLQISELTEGCQYVELRVDLLESTEESFIIQQVGLLREYCSLPIIYTVRSESQGGKFENDEAKIFDLLRLGLKLGCEFVDMECCWSTSRRFAFLAEAKNHYSSRIIASYHAMDRSCDWTSLPAVFMDCGHEGIVDIIKVVIRADSPADSYRLAALAESLTLPAPFIALASGDEGKLSRVLNLFMTPVTHPKLPAKAAPGQLSVVEIKSIRSAMHLNRTAGYYLFGGDTVFRSPSPRMHNAAFNHHRFPGRYKAVNIADGDVEALRAAIRDRNFGGASVTMPHKEVVAPLLDELSVAARSIGAVNTIYPVGSRRCGDNTDWQAIFKLVKNNLEVPVGSPAAALVLGAGGTARAACYAVKKLGLRLLIHNRTESRAALIARDFGAEVLSQVSTAPDNFETRVIISTLPPSVECPLGLEWWQAKPLVFEAAYGCETSLQTAAREAGCQVVGGLQMLLEQGLVQSAIWTNRPAPREAMLAALS